MNTHNFSLVSILPVEIILQIPAYLPHYVNPRANALLNFALTSKTVFKLLSSLLFSTLYLDHNCNYAHFLNSIKIHFATAHSLQTCTKLFNGTIDYLADNSEYKDAIHLPALQKLTELKLHFNFSVSKNQRSKGVNYSLPQNVNLPIPVINSLVGDFDGLTSVYLDGLYHVDEVIDGLANLFQCAQHLRKIEIIFQIAKKYTTEAKNSLKLSPSTADSFSHNLASLQNLQRFANSKWCLWTIPKEEDYFLLGTLSALESVPTLTDFSLTTDNKLLTLKLIQFLSVSKLSVLRLVQIEVTSELAHAIKHMRSLTNLTLEELKCSNTLFTNNPVKCSITNYKLKNTQVLDNENLVTGDHLLDLSHANCVGIESYFDLTFMKIVYQSLMDSANLCELRCWVIDETSFNLLIELIRRTATLRWVFVADFANFEMVDTVLYKSALDSFYGAIFSSSVRHLEFDCTMLNEDAIRRLLANSMVLEEIAANYEEITNELDYEKLCLSISSNSKSRFRSFVNSVIDAQYDGIKISGLYRHGANFRVKFFSKVEYDEKSRNYFSKTLENLLGRWHQTPHCLLDRVVLDHVNNADCKFLIETITDKFELGDFEVGCLDGEYCIYQSNQGE
ncbi:hypothetical protein HK098_001004 [Nowakowskiella sp. JEL0407]|nr:hypothetical protein HK098_001004 [Nowakowskiella sp. JEL0407]